MSIKDTLSTKHRIGGQDYRCVDFTKVAQSFGLTSIDKLPNAHRILLENLVRHWGEADLTEAMLQSFDRWVEGKGHVDQEILWHPSRVLMQDFTGIPAVADLAAMRQSVKDLGGDPSSINPVCPVDLVIDHSVQVGAFGNESALSDNVAKEMHDNRERYLFLKWAQKVFKDFRVVPPGVGICHQVNLEYLASVVWGREHQGELWAFPDTLVGTDSHTTMINALGVLGWGVGGIEAEAALLGQPISMQLPEVVGVKFTGHLSPGITATDLVLSVTEKLRALGVVGKFVEYFGEGLGALSLADRATLANMAPEYGATCGLFPIDQETLHYLELSGRDQATRERVETYAKALGLWYDPASTPEHQYTTVMEVDLGSIRPSMAGPKRPQDRVDLDKVAATMAPMLPKRDQALTGGVLDGDVVIAAITSCTNTSNPGVLIAAGMLAKKAVEHGLSVPPHVKCSLAPGSKVVMAYLEALDLVKPLEALGFYLVGYGCTTCIGNSGPLPDAISKAIDQDDVFACAVLSGNRNFEGRIHPQVKANWLASPPLVVAHALVGHLRSDVTHEAIGQDPNGQDVFLKDIWPSNEEVAAGVAKVDASMFQKEYQTVFEGDESWQALPVVEDPVYQWQEDSTYVRCPPFFEGMGLQPDATLDIKGAAVLAWLGDSVTTDHISPAGVIQPDSPAGSYLQSLGVAMKDFNSYGARRGNHEVMLRGTFANIRIRNRLTPDHEGGWSRVGSQGEVCSMFDAAMSYAKSDTPLIVIAGKEYGTGSSRDWAAKGTLLLGVRLVIAESFERIHRSNLIGMGVLPCQWESVPELNLSGDERFDITGIAGMDKPAAKVALTITYPDGRTEAHTLVCRIDTQGELAYYQNNGILQYVLRGMVR